MKNLFYLCLIFFQCITGISALGSFNGVPYGPRLQMGVGAGAYFNKEMSDGEMCGSAMIFAITSDYRLSERWELGMQQQMGLWQKSGYDGNMKDIDISAYAVRSFFRSGNLKFGMGLGYGARESLKRTSLISRSCLTVPAKLDLRICRCGSVSFNISSGLVLLNLGEHGLFNFYIMPVLKVSL
jgi:hypothetical protein